MKKLILFFLLIACFPAHAQVMQAPQIIGTGTPAGQYTCGAGYAGVNYIQTDATNGRLWIRDQASGSWAWDHLLSALVGTATTGTITGGNFISGGCTATTTVTVAGAAVGTNSATASPIYATAPTGNQGLFNLTAWVSAANTITVQGCALGA